MSSLSTYLHEIANFSATNREEVEQFRLRFLSKKGILAELFAAMKSIPAEEKKQYGAQVNELKQAAEAKLASFQEMLEAAADQAAATDIDLTLPAEPMTLGARHPISLIRERILQIFSRIGFTVADGPEIEDAFWEGDPT